MNGTTLHTLLIYKSFFTKRKEKRGLFFEEYFCYEWWWYRDTVLVIGPLPMGNMRFDYFLIKKNKKNKIYNPTKFQLISYLITRHGNEYIFVLQRLISSDTLTMAKSQLTYVLFILPYIWWIGCRWWHRCSGSHFVLFLDYLIKIFKPLTEGLVNLIGVFFFLFFFN